MIGRKYWVDYFPTVSSELLQNYWFDQKEVSPRLFPLLEARGSLYLSNFTLLNSHFYAALLAPNMSWKSSSSERPKAPTTTTEVINDYTVSTYKGRRFVVIASEEARTFFRAKVRFSFSAEVSPTVDSITRSKENAKTERGSLDEVEEQGLIISLTVANLNESGKATSSINMPYGTFLALKEFIMANDAPALVHQAVEAIQAVQGSPAVEVVAQEEEEAEVDVAPPSKVRHSSFFLCMLTCHD